MFSEKYSFSLFFCNYNHTHCNGIAINIRKYCNIEKLPDLILKKSLKDNKKAIAITGNDVVKYSLFEF